MRAALTRRWWALLLAGAIIAVLVVLAIDLSRDGPDTRRIGPVTRTEPHELCIAADDGELCAYVDAPAAVGPIEVGDCVELRRSSDEIFVSVRPSDRCR